MSLVSVKNKFQIVIPAKVRKQAGIKVGDLLEAKVERGKLTFVPKSVIDREIAEGLEDIKQGRFIGPFSNAKEALKALRAKTRK
ncbi:MAG: AbrB/MazE/SpoVT family DNA-binding domain-containing protein [Acidobacteria bacterium]|nr:AbrB/MazE/SpoVT family DNA-binding domain-containing protein [Acidobacteriota bacterium]MCZ6490103.1 AbrB/MazE/SpoVT family DNA-binding domain-containing protein [Acidobacteriota bacterium]MCZ6751225.1 AbrB/MazE/SpoVT family DNA-binding domain-containing protein [Acidobacteriota bacterium]